MNRRAFITRLAGGLVATATLLHLPESVALALPVGEKVRSTMALDYLRKAFHIWVMEHDGRIPSSILVGRPLYEQLESEMICVERFCDPHPSATPWINFKGVRTTASKDERMGWGYSIAA